MRCFSILAALLAGLFATPAAAEEDFNIWGGQFIFVDLDNEGEWYARGEAQERFTDDADRLGQLLLRGFVGYRINDRVNLGGGYAYILTDPVGPVEVNEHRIYQELNLTLIKTDGGLAITSRSRLEQRIFEESDATGWRYRNLVQLTAPITSRNNLIVYSEPFIGLNDVQFNGDGLTVLRNFVGVSFPIADGVSATPGYLNQTVFRDGENLSQHIANVGVTARF